MDFTDVTTVTKTPFQDMLKTENDTLIVKNENIKEEKKEKEKEELISEEIGKKFIEISSSASAHAYPNIFRAQKMELTHTLANAFVPIVCVMHLLRYLKYETLSKIEYVHESPQTLPISNILSDKESHDFVRRLIFNEDIYEPLRALYNKPSSIQKEKVSIIRDEYFHLINHLRYQIHHFLMGRAEKKRDQLLINVFQGSEVVKSELITLYYRFIYGVCFLINNDINKNVVSMIWTFCMDLI
jgi:hypothetical protein